MLLSIVLLKSRRSATCSRIIKQNAHITLTAHKKFKREKEVGGGGGTKLSKKQQNLTTLEIFNIHPIGKRI